MKTQLRDGETLVKESRANHQKNIEAVGGKLFLTTQRLVFEAHAINVQGGTTIFDLADIRSARPSWTRILGLVPLVPNAVAVETADGTTVRFTVFGRKAWAAAIKQALPADVPAAA
ncbi:Putative GRAM domain protein [Caenispirillum salinarum AK4]|uniref:Putative GRAM domain protein n=1 Tax=Caenispirillum salinarum AK4 TaxID=1238182 RepID=K9H6W7_9PROT|nr:GRAM domain-containing protein [Caenispirillum salinarum]EKV26358.1 Putative GRAM domain protein [Caenispirillum salinarum AK4]